MKRQEISEVSFLKSEKDYLSLNEVCKFFNRTRYTILRWRNNDELGFPDPLIIGTRNMQFEKQKLLTWINSLQKKGIHIPDETNLSQEINININQDKGEK